MAGHIEGMGEMTPPKGRYDVLVDENVHYMDETERYSAGEFYSCEQAIEKCKRIVDDFLLAEHKPLMTAKQLFDMYTGFGDDPFIVSQDAGCSFHAWDYARQRCEELCK
jgi:hypothetical protein